MTREAMAEWLDDLVVGDSLTAPEAERAELVAAELRKTGATCRLFRTETWDGQAIGWCSHTYRELGESMIVPPSGSCHCHNWAPKASGEQP